MGSTNSNTQGAFLSAAHEIASQIAKEMLDILNAAM
ncbi:hypothetical protein FHT70_003504 [Rhizobium sp. BK049]|nr:hypothetical protein [Rhizobium sp. BK049]